MRVVFSILLYAMAVGCSAAPPAGEAEPRVMRDRRPEVLSRVAAAPANCDQDAAPRSAGEAISPTTTPTGDLFPGGSVDPLVSPIPPADPSRFAPKPDHGWDRPSPTDPSSDFDSRFDRRTRYDDLNRMDPSHRDPPESIWERDFDPDRK